MGELISLITPIEIENAQDQIKDTNEINFNAYVAPKNDVELKLVSIWESLLNLQPIGVTEDFFDLGGTSIIAIRLFTEIEKHFKKKLQPISLLKHRTIRALSELIQDETKDKPWSALVPLRASGSKPPIFCLHAGGGHVFFYKDLAKHLGPDQPVYALQRIDLDHITQASQNIESTASHLLRRDSQGPTQRVILTPRLLFQYFNLLGNGQATKRSRGFGFTHRDYRFAAIQSRQTDNY